MGLRPRVLDPDPLPIGWAEHALAAGHWGEVLRAYVRDYNRWYPLGALSELLPQPDNRVTLADGVSIRTASPSRAWTTRCVTTTGASSRSRSGR